MYPPAKSWLQRFGMNKETIVVTLCSISILFGFLASVYLMSTVNPKPLPNIKERHSEVEEATVERRQAALNNLRGVPYGLDMTDFYESKRIGLYPNRGRKLVPPIWPRRKNKINIMPPIWPTTPISTSELTQSVKTDQYETPTTNKILPSNEPDVKSRKSRSNYMSHDDLGSIILKILNISNIGTPRIEIKLHPKGCLKKKTRNNKHAKNKSILTTKLENNTFVENNTQIENRTVINVCGNDTLVIDEDLDILELIELVKSISSEDLKNNVTNITNESITTLPSNKTVSDEKLFYNQIELFNILTENSSNINFNVCNISEVNDTSATEILKDGIDNVGTTHLDSINNIQIYDAVENSSVTDTTVKTQINNQESDKIVLDEEEIDRITQKTSHEPDQVTMINYIIQSNVTDLYIENDSDIMY